MNRKTLLAVLLALLLAAGGLAVYVRSSGPAPAAAEDCEDKPPPNEFAMAAECEAGEAPAGTPAPAPDAGSR